MRTSVGRGLGPSLRLPVAATQSPEAGETRPHDRTVSSKRQARRRTGLAEWLVANDAKRGLGSAHSHLRTAAISAVPNRAWLGVAARGRDGRGSGAASRDWAAAPACRP